MSSYWSVSETYTAGRGDLRQCFYRHCCDALLRVQRRRPRLATSPSPPGFMIRRVRLRTSAARVPPAARRARRHGTGSSWHSKSGRQNFMRFHPLNWRVPSDKQVRVHGPSLAVSVRSSARRAGAARLQWTGRHSNNNPRPNWTGPLLLLPPPVLSSSLQLSTFLGKASKVANAVLIFLTNRRHHIYRHNQLQRISNIVKPYSTVLARLPELQRINRRQTTFPGFRLDIFHSTTDINHPTTKTPAISYDNSDT